jgi:glycogen debranching enzyme
VGNKLVLKENLVFMVSREDGDVPQTNVEGLGLYYKDTRYLSVLEMKVSGYTPALLTSSGEFNFMGNIQSANPMMQLPSRPTGGNGWHPGGENAATVTLMPRTLSIRRNRFIEDGLHERVGFFNYNSFPVYATLLLRFGSDFRDMFDVRGYNRAKRGKIHFPVWDGNLLTFSYMGLDGLERRTEIVFDTPPTRVLIEQPLFPVSNAAVEQRSELPYGTSVLTTSVEPALADALFELNLEPDKPFAITYHAVPQGLGNGQAALPTTFDMGARRMRLAYEGWFRECTAVETDNEVFDRFLQRSIYDLRILMEELPTGLFPVAGIPWFAVPFGRDALITALQTLTFDPQIAVGTLRFLAQYQGKEVNDWNEEEPGKILHELRSGEMTVLREMPHIPYYGSVDSTPLFIMLFVETMRWLDSAQLYDELLPTVKRALEWIDQYADKDGDGFIEYHCHNERGVKNQGWKDNVLSLQFRDGRFPEPPIALCEAQAYVYAAKQGLAELLVHKGETAWAEGLRQEAASLKHLFNEKFWMPDEKFIAQALDRDKTQITTITSNPGHCIWCGIVDEDKINPIVTRLLTDEMSSGWGIRTVGSDEPSFNPMSYHNGSVWPHDNSIIAAGLQRNGYSTEANQVISQIFAASQRFRYFRLPELFCGFQQDNRYYSSPSEYPVSCSPQAWTAGAAIFFIPTMLGLQVDAVQRRVTLRPHFPDWLNEIRLKGLLADNQKLTFCVRRRAGQSRIAGQSRLQQEYELEVIEAGNFSFVGLDVIK